MNIGFLVLAGILAAVGALMLWFWKQLGKDIAVMAGTPTSPAGEIAKIAPGTFVEVKGTIRCERPITAEFSKQACVYHKSEVVREEVYYERDSDGKSRRKTREHILKSNVRHAPFVVEDASGKVVVNAEGATVEAVKVHDENVSSGTSNLVSLAADLLGAGGGTLHHRESVLQPDIPAYVLGIVQGDHSIGAAAKDAAVKDFVISHKSEEERTKEASSTQFWLMLIAIVLFAAALVALGYGVFTKPTGAG